MVSPELLRRYPFFSALREEQIRDVALISEEATAAKGDILFATDTPAAALFLLIEGQVELWYVVIDHHEQDLRTEFYLNDVNPGELLGLSALVAPHTYTAEARVFGPARLVKVDAAKLRALCELDPKLEAALLHQLAKALMERLVFTRAQLVGARG